MNRRSEPRFDVYYRATITPVDNPDSQIDALLTDISGGGMRLVAMQELPEDQVICVEVGQHLVLAEVRRAVPRGSRFLIGAEKVHTLSLLTLPEWMSTSDRIEALVDDYHLRIQFGLESERNSERDASAVIDAPAKPPDPADTDVLAAKLRQPPPPIPDLKEPAVPTPPQDPGMAPPMRTDPAPTSVRLVPESAASEVGFGHIRIVLPKGRGSGQEIAREALSEAAPQNQPSAMLEAPTAVDASPSGTTPDDAILSEARLSDTTPSDTPPNERSGGAPANGENSREEDPLRALRAVAIQRALAGTAEPEPRNYSRTIVALAAGLVAAVALVWLSFGPIRNRTMLRSPFASASNKGPKKTPSATPENPVIQVDPAAANPAEAASNQPAAATSASPSTPVPVAAAPTPTPVKAPSQASAGSRVHSSSLRTSAPSWFWACADGKLLGGRMLAGGSDLEIEFSRQAEVLVGNAGVVDMALDGKPLGPLGPVGSARAVELTPEGFHVATSLASQECGTP